MKKISKHISYKEAVGSNYAKQYGIKNKPNEEQVENMKLLAEKVFEPLREWVDAPIKVNSMFRSLELNTALKGSKTSSHMKGQAMDGCKLEIMIIIYIINILNVIMLDRQLIF